MVEFGVSSSVARLREVLELTIASGGVDYVKTLGHIEPWAADMDAAKEAVINGSIILEISPVPQGRWSVT